MEYRNDFLYFVITPLKRGFLYCAGVNVTGFTPITKGRHGQGSNPVVRGLQLIRVGIMDMVLSEGGRSKRCNMECAGLAPAMDTWYTEGLIVEDVPETFPAEAIRYSVINLMKKIANALRLEDRMPEDLLEPEELQEFIKKLIIKHDATDNPS